MCPDRGAALLSLKDQPVVGEQEGLGGSSASCPEPDPPLPIPVQPDVLPLPLTRAPEAALTTLLWDHQPRAWWWSFKGAALIRLPWPRLSVSLRCTSFFLGRGALSQVCILWAGSRGCSWGGRWGPPSPGAAQNVSGQAW